MHRYYLEDRYLCAELGTDELALGGWGSGGGGTGSWGHLHHHDTSEWSGARWVGNLDGADTGLSSDSSSAGGASWDGDGNGVVLVDVGCALDDTSGDQHAGHETALLGGSDVTLGTWYLGGHLSLGSGGESTSSGGVNDGGVWAKKM